MKIKVAGVGVGGSLVPTEVEAEEVTQELGVTTMRLFLHKGLDAGLVVSEYTTGRRIAGTKQEDRGELIAHARGCIRAWTEEKVREEVTKNPVVNHDPGHDGQERCPTCGQARPASR